MPMCNVVPICVCMCVYVCICIIFIYIYICVCVYLFITIQYIYILVYKQSVYSKPSNSTCRYLRLQPRLNEQLAYQSNIIIIILYMCVIHKLLINYYEFIVLCEYLYIHNIVLLLVSDVTF